MVQNARQNDSNFTHVLYPLFPEESKIFFLSSAVNVKGALKCKNIPKMRFYFELFVSSVKSLEKSGSPFEKIRLQSIVNKL